jgi:hypothetical protein
MRCLQRAISAAVLLGGMAWASGVAAMERPPVIAPVDPFALYGPEIHFQVMRNGEPVGRHTVRLEREGDLLVVTSRLDIAIKVLFVTVYRYIYESVGRWRGGRLIALDSRVDDDGEKTAVTVETVDGRLRVTGPKGTAWTGPDTMPTTHWNPRQTAQGALINTLTGEINQVDVLDRGVTEIDGGRGRIPVRHFEYTGELRLHSWYDPLGHWAGMLFEAKDKSKIEYFCVDCRGVTGPGG